jgi:hypothetical protein
MIKLAMVFIILSLATCKTVISEAPSYEVYGLKACQAFATLYETTTELMLQHKLSEDDIKKFEEIRIVAEPYCLRGDFTEEATNQYIANSVVNLVLMSKGD